MTKRDIKKELGELYSPPSTNVVPVTIPAMEFLVLDGCGDPNTSTRYAAAVEALFALSYALRFAVKRGAHATTTGSCRSKACGGPTTCRRSRLAIDRAGGGR